MVAGLISTRYHGSSAGLRLPDVMKMEFGKILWWKKWLDEKWKAEDDAVKKASRRK